ncbi:MAG: hypothetical protein ACOCUR_03145, partial [Nanoarchaeota archaeon]
DREFAKKYSKEAKKKKIEIGFRLDEKRKETTKYMRKEDNVREFIDKNFPNADVEEIEETINSIKVIKDKDIGSISGTPNTSSDIVLSFEHAGDNYFLKSGKNNVFKKEAKALEDASKESPLRYITPRLMGLEEKTSTSYLTTLELGNKKGFSNEDAGLYNTLLLKGMEEYVLKNNINIDDIAKDRTTYDVFNLALFHTYMKKYAKDRINSSVYFDSIGNIDKVRDRIGYFKDKDKRDFMKKKFKKYIINYDETAELDLEKKDVLCHYDFRKDNRPIGKNGIPGIIDFGNVKPGVEEFDISSLEVKNPENYIPMYTTFRNLLEGFTGDNQYIDKSKENDMLKSVGKIKFMHNFRLAAFKAEKTGDDQGYISLIKAS